MNIEIDQSGKIEDTAKNTILCLSNKEWDAVLITAKTKRQLQEIFRRQGQIRNYILFTFSVGLAILLRRNKKYGKVKIDLEYYGKELIIQKIIFEMTKREKGIPDIHFGKIGKKSMAHNRAYAIGLKKLKAKTVLLLEEVLKEIKKTEVGKRLKNA